MRPRIIYNSIFFLVHFPHLYSAQPDLDICCLSLLYIADGRKSEFTPAATSVQFLSPDAHGGKRFSPNRRKAKGAHKSYEEN